MAVKKKNKAIIPKIFFILCLGFSFFICKTAIFGQAGVRDFYHLNNKLSAIKDENYRLRGKNTNLEERINSIRSDSFHFEKIAREELGFVKKGEIVFEFLQEKK